MAPDKSVPEVRHIFQRVSFEKKVVVYGKLNMYMYSILCQPHILISGRETSKDSSYERAMQVYITSVQYKCLVKRDRAMDLHARDFCF